MYAACVIGVPEGEVEAPRVQELIESCAALMYPRQQVMRLRQYCFAAVQEWLHPAELSHGPTMMVIPPIQERYQRPRVDEHGHRPNFSMWRA